MLPWQLQKGERVELWHILYNAWLVINLAKSPGLLFTANHFAPLWQHYPRVCCSFFQVYTTILHTLLSVSRLISVWFDSSIRSLHALVHSLQIFLVDGDGVSVEMLESWRISNGEWALCCFFWAFAQLGNFYFKVPEGEWNKKHVAQLSVLQL